MISLILALGENNLIGKGNDLPWHYEEDLRYFKNTTLNKKVIMGENTFFSIVNRIGKPLPKRENYVATLDDNFHYDGVEIVNDLISFLKENENKEEEIFVIGGMQIYNLSLPFASKLYITHINKEYDGDVYFPTIDYSKYEMISRNDINELSFCVYERK